MSVSRVSALGILGAALWLGACAQVNNSPRDMGAPSPTEDLSGNKLDFAGSLLDSAVNADAAQVDLATPSDLALPCAYTCTVTMTATTTMNTCSGKVTPTLSSGGQFLASVNTSSLTSMSVNFQVCDPTGWTLHITDDKATDGYGGGSLDNCAEAQLLGTTLGVYANNFSTPAAMLLASQAAYAPASGCSTHTITTYDQRLVSDTPAMDLTSPYLLRINPPTDTLGPVDAIWWVGFNRTLGSSSRTGTGLKTATICLR